MYLKSSFLILFALFSSCIGCDRGLGEFCRNSSSQHTFGGPIRCEDGLTCVGASCEKLVEAGESCACFETGETGFGDTLMCDGLCSGGFFCNTDKTPFVCAEDLKENDPCSDLISPAVEGRKTSPSNNGCPDPLRCNKGFNPPLCKPLQPEGGKCDEPNDCEKRRRCNKGFNPPSCQPLQPMGGKCTVFDDCQRVGDCQPNCYENQCSGCQYTICIEECVEELRSKNLHEGYSCSCLETVCEDPSQCGSLDGFQKYECVEACSLRGAAMHCQEDSAGCNAPRYFDEDWAEEIIVDSCKRRCLAPDQD